MMKHLRLFIKSLVDETCWTSKKLLAELRTLSVFLIGQVGEVMLNTGV